MDLAKLVVNLIHSLMKLFRLLHQQEGHPYQAFKEECELATTVRPELLKIWSQVELLAP